MEHFNLSIENELSFLETYNLNPTELFVIKTLLLAIEEDCQSPLQRVSQIINLRDSLNSLQEKGIILKSWKLPKEGSKLDIYSIPLNKNFVKRFFRSSYEMGNELFEAYPQTCVVSGQVFNLRRVSKKFNSLEDAFAKYGKYIKYNNETHNYILELIRWGIENGYTFTTLDSFIVDQDWRNIANIKEGNGINVNSEAVKMI